MLQGTSSDPNPDSREQSVALLVTASVCRATKLSYLRNYWVSSSEMHLQRSIYDIAAYRR